MNISAKQIQKNLKKINAYKDANTIACYYSIGSEVKTHDILQEILSHGKKLALPRVENNRLVFCNIGKFEDLEKGEFGIMEPKLSCSEVTEFDVIIVPSIAMARNGQRLGYGMGYYDRFLMDIKTTSIALTYSKSIVKNIPSEKNDIPIQWIVTEDSVIRSEIH